MKTKTKILALVEIAVVLCSVFLVAIPAIVADQTMQKVSANTITTASEDDYVLDIYGNANEDDTIDMGDVVYVKLAIFGKKPKTELCDAKYDGRINVLDVIQTKLIILGKEKELTIVDTADRMVTVKKPVKRIIALDDGNGEPLRVLGAEDQVVGVGSSLATHDILLPEMSKLPVVAWGGGGGYTDYEKVIALKPDLFFAFAAWGWCHRVPEKLEPYGIPVLLLDCMSLSQMEEEIRKLGYVVGEVDRAEEFVNFHERCQDNIKERTEGLSEDEKPRVYIESIAWGGGSPYQTALKGSKLDEACTMAGGINIAHDIERGSKIDAEWVIYQNPDIIVKAMWKSGYHVEDTTGMKAIREEIMNRPELANVNAVKNGNVYGISADLAGSGMQGFVSAAYMAKWLHPNLFKDLDPEAIHQEYIDRFIRIDYDVKRGAFFYPPFED